MIALTMLLTVPAAAGAETLREQSRRSVEIAGVSEVVAQNARGRVEVRPSPDKSLHLTAIKIVRAGSGSTARSLAAATVVELNREGRRYEIRVRYPRSHNRVNLWDGLGEVTIPRAEVRLTLEVPRGVAVQLDGASADLFGEYLGGSLRMKSASGDAEVRACTGDVEVSTASGDVFVEGSESASVQTVSGDVRVERTKGPLHVSSSSGDVQIAELSDSLEVDTVSGDVTIARAPLGATLETSSGQIQLRRASGRVRAKTVSGDVRADLVPPLKGAEITTASGEIGVGLASAVGCKLEMRTSSGSLDISVPCRTQTLTRRLVSAVVGEGSAKVVLRSVSGDISVNRGEP